MAGHVVELDEATLGQLIDGQLPWDDVHHIQSSYKDPRRFDTYVRVLQARVGWPDPIVLPLSPYLSIVRNAQGIYAVKCLCGQEFGDYRQNWKTAALIHVRDTEESMQEIWPGPRCPDPEKNEIREFFCPTCGRQLEVDAVPPGYPILANFTPDLEAFYRDWLGRPLP
ncbi:MAG: acetone carboxylase subunit gamma [Gammaproteobacteria bacterium]